MLTEPRSAVTSGKALDDLVAAEAVLACEFEEIPGPGEYGTALGRAGHGNPAVMPHEAMLPVMERGRQARSRINPHNLRFQLTRQP